jgi:hypothetical protein
VAGRAASGAAHALSRLFERERRLAEPLTEPLDAGRSGGRRLAGRRAGDLDGARRGRPRLDGRRRLERAQLTLTLADEPPERRGLVADRRELELEPGDCAVTLVQRGEQRVRAALRVGNAELDQPPRALGKLLLGTLEARLLGLDGGRTLQELRAAVVQLRRGLGEVGLETALEAADLPSVSSSDSQGARLRETTRDLNPYRARELAA